VKASLCTPSWDACRSCGQYSDFCDSLEPDGQARHPSLTHLCQGGCLGYHCAP
jgi:hypothetical protein